MASIKEVISLCKEGKLQDAYEIARQDLQTDLNNVWAQKTMGWVLYYIIKDATEKAEFKRIINSLHKLRYLNLLNWANDAMIYNSILFKLGEFLKNKIPLNDFETNQKLSLLFYNLRCFNFPSSDAYSFLLDRFLKFKNWNEFADFIDWWDLNKLRKEDFEPFTTKDGNKIMCLAERAFNTNAKALLVLGDIPRIQNFLPKLNTLRTAHPEMLYPNYFYGKLLLCLNTDKEKIIDIILPFARKKSADFWVWQLFSDIYKDDQNMQLACLLRAVNCNAQENFLGKVRIKLANLYIQLQDFERAKFHIDAVYNCYSKNAWPLPSEICKWIQEPWIATITPNSTAPIDYMNLTDSILYKEATESTAIVTYIDTKNQKVHLIYGHKLKTVQKLKVRFKLNIGSILKIKYIIDSNNRPKIFNIEKTSLTNELPYLKEVKGIIEKRENNNFAFLKTENLKYYVSPNVVQIAKLNNGDKIHGLVVIEYDKKKENWNWVCVKAKKNQTQYNNPSL